MLYVSVARHGNRWSLTTSDGIAAEEGARSKTLITLARSSTGLLRVLAEGAAGIWGPAGRFIRIMPWHNRMRSRKREARSTFG